MKRVLAGIDVHKKLLMVVVATVAERMLDGVAVQTVEYEARRFGSGSRERQHRAAWLLQHGTGEVVMESTAQYWKPVWQDLEQHFAKGKMHLAQAYSNRAPKGRKNDFGDAEKRTWRTVTRGRLQLVGQGRGEKLGLILDKAGYCPAPLVAVSGCRPRSRACWKRDESSSPAWSATCSAPVRGASWPRWRRARTARPSSPSSPTTGSSAAGRSWRTR